MSFNEKLIREYKENGKNYGFNSCPNESCQVCKDIFEGERQEQYNLLVGIDDSDQFIPHNHNKTLENLETVEDYLNNEQKLHNEYFFSYFVLSVLEGYISLVKDKKRLFTLNGLSNASRKLTKTVIKDLELGEEDQHFLLKRLIGYELRQDFKWRYLHFLTFLAHQGLVEFGPGNKNSAYGSFKPTEKFSQAISESMEEDRRKNNEILRKNLLSKLDTDNPLVDKAVYFDLDNRGERIEKIKGKIQYISGSDLLTYQFPLKEILVDGEQVNITLYDYWERKFGHELDKSELKQLKTSRVITVLLNYNSDKQLYWASPIIYPSSRVYFKEGDKYVEFDVYLREMLLNLIGNVGYNEQAGQEALNNLRDYIEKNEPELLIAIAREKIYRGQHA